MKESFFEKYAPYILVIDIVMALFFGLCTVTAVQVHNAVAAAFGAVVTMIWVFNVVLDVAILHHRNGG